MTQIKAHIPKIRFKEFSGEWENGKIEDNFQVRMCKRIFNHETSNDGEIPFYKIGTIGKQADSFISKELFDEYKTKYNYPKKGELMLTCSGTVGRTIIFDGKDSYFQDSNIVWLDNQKSEINNNFLYYIISNYDWGKLNATTITRIYNDDLRKLKISFPSLPEQQKIASFLSSVDEKIEKIKEKKKNLEEYKKGVMQKIFSQEIRFKDENGEEFGEWEEVKLGELLNYKQPTNYIVKSEEYNDSYNIPVLTAGKTFILGYTNENFGIFEAKNNPVIIFDDFTTSKQFVNFDFKVKSSAMKILKNIDDKISNIKYIFEFMETIKFSLGDEHKRYWISEYSKININLPTLKEQEKIADFLSGIDEKIEKVSDELEKIEEFKKGLLQGLFV